MSLANICLSIVVSHSTPIPLARRMKTQLNLPPERIRLIALPVKMVLLEDFAFLSMVDSMSEKHS